MWLLGFAVAAAQAHIDGPAAAAVLDALAGDWSGTALRTPRGVLPYDICLERTPAGVGGVANPGAAFHHWEFHLRGGVLKLRFLTTFGGNETPTWLTAENFTGGTLWFRADALDHLRVGVEHRPGQVDIHVRLHDRPHVHIRLLRRAAYCDHTREPGNRTGGEGGTGANDAAW